MGSKIPKHAFTIVELLVVIAIIAVLLAIMAPSLNRLRDITRNTVCSSNLHQLGLAQTIYTNDNKGSLTPMRQWCPESHKWDSSTALIKTGALWKYINSEAVYLCPTFAQHAKLMGAAKPSRSYTISWNIGGKNDFNGSEPIDKSAAVAKPGELGVFTEENLWIVGDMTYRGQSVPYRSKYTINDPQMIAPDWPDRDTIATYHSPPLDDHPVTPFFGSGNLVFLDNHVESIPWDFSAPTSTRKGDIRPLFTRYLMTW